MKTTVIFNCKGGVGKTITAINMAAELAARGARVALLDCDPQCNASTFCGADTDCDTTYAVLMGVAESYYPASMQPVTFSAPSRGSIGFDILPASGELVMADISSALRDNRANLRALRDLVETMAEDDAYQHVIIDCPPSFTAATSAALIAADDVVIPLKLDAFSFDGLGELTMQVVGMRQLNPRLRIAGALITMRDANTIVAREVETALRASAVPVFDATIRRAEAVNASTFQRLPLRLMQGKSAAAVAVDYAAFVTEYQEGGARRG